MTLAVMYHLDGLVQTESINESYSTIFFNNSYSYYTYCNCTQHLITSFANTKLYMCVAEVVCRILKGDFEKCDP